MSSRRPLMVLVAISLAGACGGAPTLPVDESITRFVETEALLNSQQPRIMLQLPEFQAQLFLVSYGEPSICQPVVGGTATGPCYFDKAIGLEYRGRIGWLQGVPDGGAATAFEFRAEDDELYGAPIAIAWRRADAGSYSTIFSFALVRAAATPRPTLLRLANELRDWFYPSKAWLMLSRPDVRGDAEILTIIAELPVAQGDPYAANRLEARRLLDSLNALQRGD